MLLKNILLYLERMLMFNKKRKPTAKVKTYLKYGFVITEHEYHFCPKCGHSLNAGPNYQPKFCEQCGQHITFKGIKWKEDKVLGYTQIEERREDYAPIKNRMGR